MSIWDRGSEVAQPGRWHVRMVSPAGVVEFADFVLTDPNDAATDAVAAAAIANPGYFIEWAIWEPDHYGVWANGFGPGAPIDAIDGREE